MKVSMTENNVFSPINITITIDSVSELETLWHRFNVSKDAIREASSSPFGNSITLVDDWDIFDLLDSIAVDGGYKKWYN